jgi:hypothetical protein
LRLAARSLFEIRDQPIFGHDPTCAGSGYGNGGGQRSCTLDNGGGGADIGPFTATLTIPSSPFVWTNADANMSIARSAGVDIAWTGGDPNGKVVIQGSQTSNDPATLQPTVSGLFICTVDNTGDFFVPSDVLSLLPAATFSQTGTLIVSNNVVATFNAAGSDMSSFQFQSSATRIVDFK